MNRFFLKSIFMPFCAVLLSGCAVVLYPGQPGMVSSSFVKLDLEILEEPGLYVYEAVYDNTSSGQGVSAVITKLYPNAQTYTTNVRTNADGTLFRVKAQYNGADIQMVSMPQQNQVYLNPNHQIAFLIDYENSIDEIDDKNVAEENLFKPSALDSLRPKSFETKRMKWQLIKAARFLPNGNLGYELTALQMGQYKFVPSQPINLETSLAQNSIKTTLTPEMKQEFSQFLEANFPKGYRGKVDFYVKDSLNPISFNLGVNTLKTAEASGLKVIKGIPEGLLRKVTQ
ncbi:MAG: hypothetical protein EBQ92_10945 [Proteobacteria bacterium]|nr:hypothetical protein [Pseudomonadota bacterium]